MCQGNTTTGVSAAATTAAVNATVTITSIQCVCMLRNSIVDC